MNNWKLNKERPIAESVIAHSEENKLEENRTVSYVYTERRLQSMFSVFEGVPIVFSVCEDAQFRNLKTLMRYNLKLFCQVCCTCVQVFSVFELGSVGVGKQHSHVTEDDCLDTRTEEPKECEDNGFRRTCGLHTHTHIYISYSTAYNSSHISHVIPTRLSLGYGITMVLRWKHDYHS